MRLADAAEPGAFVFLVCISDSKYSHNAIECSTNRPSSSSKLPLGNFLCAATLLALFLSSTHCCAIRREASSSQERQSKRFHAAAGFSAVFGLVAALLGVFLAVFSSFLISEKSIRSPPFPARLAWCSSFRRAARAEMSRESDFTASSVTASSSAFRIAFPS